VQQISIDDNTTVNISGSDTDTDFLAATKLWLGNSNTVGVLNDMKLSEFVGYNIDQSATNLAIRQNQVAAWKNVTSSIWIGAVA
jgi:hypothetical protein